MTEEKKVVYADKGHEYTVQHIVKELYKTQSGALGIGRMLSETDYSALTEPEDPVKMLGLADGLVVIAEKMFSLLEDLSAHLIHEDKGGEDKGEATH